MRVAIIGSGLIGGSIGLAVKANLPGAEVSAYDRDPAAAQAAVQMGAADRTADSVANAVEGAEMVFVATPVSAIPAAAIEAGQSLGKGAVITDVGSTKVQVVVEVGRDEGAGRMFIGGHPMAGSEDAGIEAARADLFEGAWWILTPTDRTTLEALSRLETLLATLGARTAVLSPTEHDELLAVISHLPQLLATTLMNVAGQDKYAGLLGLSAGGFRDVTRVAASHPDIWVDICRDNRDAIVAGLDTFAATLATLRDAIARDDDQHLRAALSRAREARRALPGKALSPDAFEVRVVVPDRPGVLAEITALVGSAGINIEDLGITHAREGGRGTVRLGVTGEDAARSVEEFLTDHGYDAKAIGL